MTLENEFNQAYASWREHCMRNSVHSMSEPYINCDPFRKIVSFGLQALPLIRQAYAAESGLLGDPFIYWPLAIRQIAPEFRLPVDEEGSGTAVEHRGEGFVAGDVHKVKRATLCWLDKYLSAQVKT